MTIKNEVAYAVDLEKRRLMAQVRRLGLVPENFGNKACRKLDDKYFGLAFGDSEEREAYRIISAFYDWCENYTLERMR